jgi:hypothetical protein
MAIDFGRLSRSWVQPLLFVKTIVVLHKVKYIFRMLTISYFPLSENPEMSYYEVFFFFDKTYSSFHWIGLEVILENTGSCL